MDKLTAQEFIKLLENSKLINNPAYRGAEMPEFDPNKINESTFEDEWRFKDVCFTVADWGNTLEINWVSQDVGSDEGYSLFNEIYRALANLAKTYLAPGERVPVLIRLSDRDASCFYVSEKLINSESYLEYEETLEDRMNDYFEKSER